MKRNRLALLLSVLLILCLCVVAFGQRIKKHGALMDATPAGAITIAPATGQGITLGGGTNITGNTTVVGTLASSGNFSVNTNKFTVAASSGNTAVAGTLTVGGGTAIAKVLSASASLDYGATAAGACDTLTITVTGAADGDPVFIGVPVALATADSYQLFRGYVSAADTVAVKRCNLTNATTALSNPAAATVRVAVFHF